MRQFVMFAQRKHLIDFLLSQKLYLFQVGEFLERGHVVVWFSP